MHTSQKIFSLDGLIGQTNATDFSAEIATKPNHTPQAATYPSAVTMPWRLLTEKTATTNENCERTIEVSRDHPDTVVEGDHSFASELPSDTDSDATNIQFNIERLTASAIGEIASSAAPRSVSFDSSYQSGQPEYIAEETSAAKESNIINVNHFGINYVADYERIGSEPWEKFDDIVAETGASVLRYPGGIAAETVFNIDDPNAEQYLDSDGILREIMPLDEFLDYCLASDTLASIIIPTASLLTTSDSYGERRFDVTKADSVYDFVWGALEASWPNSVFRFEIGNEYESHMSSAEYGRVASSIALIAQSAIDDFLDTTSGEIVEPQLAVQVWAESTNEGLSQSELEARNLTVLSEFDNDELQSVDAVVGHLYYKEGRHSGEVGEHEYSNIDNMVGTSVALLNVWQEAVGNDKDLDLAFSEWNVNHNSDESFGLVQVGYMISMFDEFVRQGVDSLNFWSAQYHPTSLAVDGGTLSPVGEIFCYMRSNLIGSNPTDLTFDQSGFDAFAYSSDFGIEVIIVSTSEHSETLSLSYDSLSANLQLDDALLLGVDPESCDGIYKNVVFENCWFEPDAHPIWTTLDNSLNSIDNEIVFSVGAYEVVCLSFLYTDIDEQSELNPDDELIDLVFDVINGNDVSDYINGGGRSDLISGLQGHDTLIGGQGADTVFGGLDDDQVEGKSGHDYILGENGNDTLSGDTDRDTIDGGDGDDSVQGGQGSDFLLGDNGKDYLSGGDGDDWIEGGDGGDTISGGASGDALFGGDGGDSISGNQGSDEISGDNGADLLKGNGGHDMIFGGSGNDTIHGGEGRDTICGDAGNDVLFGELGADVFVYTGGQDVVRDLTLVDEIEFGEILGESPHGADAYSVIRQESSVVFDFGNGNSLEIIGGFSVDELLEISTFL